MSTRFFAALAVGPVFAATLLSSCGGGGSDGGETTVTVTPSSSASPGSDASGLPTAQTITPTVPAAGDVDPATYRDRNFGYFFSTPSNKFTCGISLKNTTTPAAGCQGTTAPVPPRPASCGPGPGWGHGMQVNDAGATSFLCTGGLIFGFSSGRTPTLEYGHSLTAAGFRCTVQTTGITCTQLASGHGFMIAAETNRQF